jgi:hypothetical protein
MSFVELDELDDASVHNTSPFSSYIEIYQHLSATSMFAPSLPFSGSWASRYHPSYSYRLLLSSMLSMRVKGKSTIYFEPQRGYGQGPAHSH